MVYAALSILETGTITAGLIITLPAALHSISALNVLFSKFAILDQFSQRHRSLARPALAAALGFSPHIFVILCIVLHLIWTVSTTMLLVMRWRAAAEKLMIMLGQEGRRVVFQFRYQGAVVRHCRLQDAEEDCDDNDSQDNWFPECEYHYEAVLLSSDEDDDDDYQQVGEEDYDEELESGFAIVR